MAPPKKKTTQAEPVQAVALPGFTAPPPPETWEDVKPAKLSPFDFLAAINDTKTDLIDQNPDVEREYNPFMVGRGLSYFADSAKAANLMNERHGTVTKGQHFKFLLNIIPRRKRFSKWFKPEDDDTVTLIAAYYNTSPRQAREMVNLHTPEQLTIMRARLYEGGNKK